MSIRTPTPAAENPTGISPRRPTPEQMARIAGEARRWATGTANVRSVTLYTHPDRPTVRCAVLSQDRAYDPALDDAVTALDLSLAQDPALEGIDVELRLFFAGTPEQVAAWARGWEPWTDA